MKMNKITTYIFFAIIFLSSILNAKDLSLDNDSTKVYRFQRYSKKDLKSRSFSHNRLDLEKKYFEVEQEDYSIVDRVLTNAKNNKILKENLTKNSINKQNLEIVAQTIHRLLRKEGFIYGEEPTLLHKGLESQILSCTTFSTIYRDIFREFGIKTGAVLAPGHVFIRVLFEKDNYFNIETTTGEIESDQDYTIGKKISTLAINNGVFLKTLNNREAQSLWYLSNAPNTHDSKQLKKNIRIFKKIIKLHPANVIAHENLGFTYDKLEQISLAMKKYNKAISLNPNSYFAHLGKGSIYRQLGKIDKSIEECTKAIALKPDYYDAFVARAKMYFISKKYNKAVLDYTKCISLKPEVSKNYIAKGSTYFLLDIYDKALEEYNTGIMLSPEDSTPYHLRGKIFYILNRYSEAISDYNKSIELDFEGSQEKQFAYKSKIYNLESYIKLIKSMKEQLSQDSVYIKAEKLKVENIKNKSDNLKYFKIKNYTKLISLNTKNDKAYYERGKLYVLLGKYDKGIADLNKVISLVPDAYNAYFYRGFAYMFSKENKKAITDYTKAISINPYDAIAYTYRANCYKNLKLYNKAIIDLKKAFDLEPENIDNLIDFAWLYLLKNEPDNASIYLKKAFEVDSDDPYIQTRLVIYFILKNEILKAKKIYSFLDKESKENLLYDIDDLKEEGIKNINFDEFKI